MPRRIRRDQRSRREQSAYRPKRSTWRKQVTLDGLAVMLAGATEPLGVGRISIEYVKSDGRRAAGVGDRRRIQDLDAECRLRQRHDGARARFRQHVVSAQSPDFADAARDPRDRRARAPARAENHRSDRRRIRSAGARAARRHRPGNRLGFSQAGDHRHVRRRRGRRAPARSRPPADADGVRPRGLARGQHLDQHRHHDQVVALGPRGAHGRRMRGARAHGLDRERRTCSGRKAFSTRSFKAKESRRSSSRVLPNRCAWSIRASASRSTRAITSRTGRSTPRSCVREAHGIDPATSSASKSSFPRFDYVNRPFPKPGLDGKFSVQYTTAVALLDGEVTIDSFTNERRFAPDVEALLPRVEADRRRRDTQRLRPHAHRGDGYAQERRAPCAARAGAFGLGRLSAHARAAAEEIPFVRAARARQGRRRTASSSSWSASINSNDVSEIMDLIRAEKSVT